MLMGTPHILSPLDIVILDSQSPPVCFGGVYCLLPARGGSGAPEMQSGTAFQALGLGTS